MGLLIGSHVPRALEAREIKSGNHGEQYATRTDLGWVVNGPLRKRGNSRRTANLITADEELSKQFEKYCNMEFNDSYYDNKVTLSQEDKKALQKMKSYIQLKGGQYEIGLPWREGCPALPNNRSMVENRLHHLKKRLEKEPILLEKYTAFMEDLLQKGFARRVPQHMTMSQSRGYSLIILCSIPRNQKKLASSLTVRLSIAISRSIMVSFHRGRT